MKKLLSIAIAILVLPSFCFPFTAFDAKKACIARKGASGVACTSANDGVIIDSGWDTHNGVLTDNYRAQKAVLGSQSDVTGYILGGCDSFGTGNNLVQLYTHNGGTDKPDTAVANTSIAFDPNGWIACEANENHEILLASVYDNLAAGTYWIVWEENGGVNSQSSMDNSGETSRVCVGADGAAWTCFNTTAMNHNLLGCDG